MLTDIFFHLHALLSQLELHHLFHQRAAPTAAGRRFGALLDGTDVRRTDAYCLADITFADVMTGADLRAVRQRRHPQRFWRVTGECWQDERFRLFRQADSVKHHLHQRGVFAGIPHQHAAEQGFVVMADDNFFIDLLRAVGPLVAQCPRRTAMGIPKRGHVHAQQLKFGAHIRAGEGFLLTRQRGRRHACHLITRRHQAEDFTFPQRALPDGEDVLI